MRQLVQLQADFKKIDQAKIRLIGISYDSTDVLKKFTDENKIAFLLLSDPASKVIDAYELRNENVPKRTRQDGVPHPVTVLVDRKGIVRAKLGFADVRERHTTKELIDAVKQIRAD